MTIAAAKKHLRSIRYDQVKIMQLMDKREAELIREDMKRTIAEQEGKR